MFDMRRSCADEVIKHESFLLPIVRPRAAVADVLSRRRSANCRDKFVFRVTDPSKHPVAALSIVEDTFTQIAPTADVNLLFSGVISHAVFSLFRPIVCSPLPGSHWFRVRPQTL